MERRLRLLYVANKRLPDSDYRLCYRHATTLADVVYGLPAKPATLESREFLRLGFDEGIRLSDAANLWKLFHYLRASLGSYDLVHFFSTKLQLFGPICAM